MKTIVLVFVLFISVLARAESVRDKRNKNKLNRKYSVPAVERELSACKEIDTTKRIYLTLEDGKVKYSHKMLKKDRGQLYATKLLEQQQLIDFKTFLIKNLSKKINEIKLLNSCHEKSCKTLFDNMIISLKKKLSDLRIYLSLKDKPTPLGKFEVAKPKKIVHKIRHDQLIGNHIPPLSSKEAQKASKIYDHMIKEHKQDILKENEDKYGICLKFNKAQRSLDHTRKRCARFISELAIESSNRLETISRKKYQKLYDQIIEENPLLLYLNIRGDEKNTVLKKQLLTSLKKIKDSMSTTLTEIKDAKKLEDLVLYTQLVNVYINISDSKKINCQLFQRLRENVTLSQTLKEIATTAGIISAGALCGGGNIICSIAMIIGAESATIAYYESVRRNRLNELNSKLITIEEMNQITEQEKLSIIMTPLVLGSTLKLLNNTKILISPQKQIKAIEAATVRDRSIQVPFSKEFEKNIEKINNYIESDLNHYKFTTGKREIPIPPPLEKLERLSFHEPKPFVSRSNRNYDFSVNGIYSAVSKTLTNPIKGLFKKNYSSKELKLMTEEIVDIIPNPDSGITSSFIVTLKDGTKAIFKPNTKSWAANSRAETVAYQVNDFLDFDLVPLTVERTIGGQRGSLQLIESYKWQGDLDKVMRGEVNKSSFFDFLIDHRDRAQNFLVREDGTIILIDNALSLTGRGASGTNYDLVLSRAGAFIRSDDGKEVMKKLRAYNNEKLKQAMIERIGEEDAERFMERVRFLIRFQDRMQPQSR